MFRLAKRVVREIKWWYGVVAFALALAGVGRS